MLMSSRTRSGRRIGADGPHRRRSRLGRRSAKLPVSSRLARDALAQKRMVVDDHDLYRVAHIVCSLRELQTHRQARTGGRACDRRTRRRGSRRARAAPAIPSPATLLPPRGRIPGRRPDTESVERAARNLGVDRLADAGCVAECIGEPLLHEPVDADLLRLGEQRAPRSAQAQRDMCAGPLLVRGDHRVQEDPEAASIRSAEASGRGRCRGCPASPRRGQERIASTSPWAARGARRSRQRCAA